MRARTLACCLSTLLCLGALAAQTEAPKKYLLRYAFEEGKTACSVVTQHLTQKMNGGEETSTFDLQMFTSQRVVEKKDGKARIVVSIDRMKSVAKVRGRRTVDEDYDSDVPGSDPGRFAAMAAMVGKEVEIWMGARGSKTPDKLEEDPTSGIEQAARQHWLMLPDKPVAVGDTWETELPMALGEFGNQQVKVKNKLIEVAGSKARIEQLMDTTGLKTPADVKLAFEKSCGTTTIDLAGWQSPETTMELVSTRKGEGVDLCIETTMAIKAAEPPKKAQLAKANSQAPGTEARQIFQRYVFWLRSGNPDGKGSKCVEATGHIQRYGVDGSIHVLAVDDGRFREDLDFHGWTESRGIDSGGAWRMNSSGYVFDVYPGDAAWRSAEQQQKWFARFPDGTESKARIPTDSAQTEGARTIAIRNGDQEVELAIGNDGELIRTRRRLMGFFRTTAFSDWRSVGGLMLPFHEDAVIEKDHSIVVWERVTPSDSLDDKAIARPLTAARGTFESGATREALRLETDGAYCFVSVTVKGEVLQALLDTGSEDTIINAAKAGSVGIAPGASVPYPSAIGDLRRGGKVVVGAGKARYSVDAMVGELDHLDKMLGRHVDMILGNSLLLSFVVQIDLASRTLTLSDPKSFQPPPSATTAPMFLMSSGLAIVEARVEALPTAWFVMDSGADVLYLTSPYVEQHQLLSGRTLQKETVPGAGEGATGVVDSFEFAGRKLAKVKTFFVKQTTGASSADEFAGIIGAWVTRGFTVAYDVSRNRLWVWTEKK